MFAVCFSSCFGWSPSASDRSSPSRPHPSLNFRAYIFTVLVFIIGKEEKRGTNVRWGKKQIIYLSLHSHHQNDSCIKMGSDESHCNVSLTVRDKVTRQCPQTTAFEKKGEPKQIRTDLYLPACLPPGQTGSVSRIAIVKHFELSSR